MKLSVLRPRRDPVSPEPSTTSPEVRPPWWREWIPSAKTLRDELRRNPGLKLVSLLLAIMLWGTINVTERDAERIVELPVSLRKLQQGLIVTNPPGKPVTITLRGPRTILDHVDEHTSRVSVDLSSIGPGDARIELNTDMVRPELPRRLKVVRMEPARVKLKIDRLIRRSLPVRADLAGTPALGFMVAESRVVPDQIEVSGPATKVDELKEIPTEPIDLRGMNENGERSVLLGWVGDFIGFAPDRVTVYFTFEQVMVSREFKRVPVRARRADGVTVRLAPAFVDLTVRGPQVILHNLKIPDDAVWVDATDLKPGTHKVSPRVDLPGGLEVVRWQPDALQAQVAEGGRALMGLNGGRHLFGTDGVRGVANVEPMTSETALRLGRALAHVSKRSPHRHKILIGKDTRLSGYMLEQAMASGICSMGVDVLLVGPLPTPGIAFLTRSLRADAGVVISASHNPFQDNGIKFFSKAGFKLPDEVEHEIERLVLSDSIDALRPTKTEVGKAFRIDDAVGRYNVFAKSCFPRQLTLDGLTVAVDCGNGAAYRVAPEVLEELGARVVPLGVTPDGENINQNCGALYPRSLQEAVRVSGANVGIALDGDADRAIFVDEHGEVVDGDEIMAMLAADLDRRGELKARTLVATVMSNLGLHMAMRDRGIRVTTTPVGDRYVVEEMLRSGYNLGGEQSGHIVFLDHNTTGDGLITCLAVLALMVDKDVSLSELRQVMRRFPQVLLNVPVGRKPPIETVPDLQAAVTRAERALGERGRVLVRYSGTESLIRVMIEGEDESGIREMAESIVGVARKVLGAPAR